MPGPLLTVGIAETPRNGWKTGPVISIGHAIAEIGVVLVLTLGFAALAQNPIVTGLIGVLGGAALILMGISMGLGVVRGSVSYDYNDSANRSNNRILVAKGITASLSNPYWFVWWGTTGLAFVVKSLEYGYIGPVVFYFGHILSDFVWYTVVTVLLWAGKRVLFGVGLKVLIGLCALFLLYLGVTFILDGLDNFA